MSQDVVSIIIVNYNSGDLLRACLQSLRTYVTVPYEIVVVDNNSSDDSFDLPEAPDLVLVPSKDNLGFARGCNLGAAHARGSYFYFLNPDTEVTHNINDCFMQAMQEKTPAIYVTRLLDTTNRSERSSHPIPTLGNTYNLIFHPERVDRWYLGASVLLSRALFERLGRWSSEYFMYSEDMDLFYKARLAGIPTIETASIVVHHQGGSSRRVWSDRERLARVERSAMIFARKFNLVPDYFVFKHLAFCKVVWKKPVWAVVGMMIFWKEFLRALIQPRLMAKNSTVLGDQ